MINLVPGILEEDWESVKEKLDILTGLTDWVHIDVSDGQFTPNKIWARPEDLLGMGDIPKVEVHLMVSDIVGLLPPWLDSLVTRIIFHQEAAGDDASSLVRKIKGAGKEAILAFNTNTDWQKAEDVLPHVDGVLLLSVRPGGSGQGMDTSVFKKASSLHDKYPSLAIEVDGGVKPSLIKDLMASGVTRFVSTSYVYKGKGPQIAIEEYKKEIDKYNDSV